MSGRSSLSQIVKPVFPNLRPLIELGRGEEALALAQRLERGQTSIGIGLSRFDPLDYHLARYYQGRAHELLADTLQAIEGYRTVVDHWGDGIANVPELADVAERLETLRSD